MKAIGWLRRSLGDVELNQDSAAWGVSLVTHMALLVLLAVLWQNLPSQRVPIMLASYETAVEPPSLQEVQYTASSDPEVGAASVDGVAAALAAAPTLDSISRVEARDTPPVEAATIDVPLMEELSTAENLDARLLVKGDAGVGATGADGAVDRITQEILLSLEQRPTVVVWLLDQSESLRPQRAAIEKRFDRIYEELGVVAGKGNDAFAKHADRPLLTSIMAFGKQVNFLVKEPTDSLSEIKAAVHGVETDPDGIEMTFTAVTAAAQRYQKYRTQAPRRNVMLIVVTDEAGNDEGQLEAALNACRRQQMPVFVIGVPAPFGQRQAFVKYVDPDPQFNQSVQNLPVDQGPESAAPENVQLGFSGGDWDPYDALDSGFGPYALTRLCYETGGIFFAVHPNRPQGGGGVNDTAIMAARIRHFFDPSIMRNYLPDYAPQREYEQLVKENKARAALVQAAQLSLINPMEKPRLVFPKRDEAGLKNELDVAQRAAAVVEPKIEQLYQVLKTGEKDRAKLTGARWQAGYDLAMGRALAVKVRTVSYNAMLAQAKNGMKFQRDNSDTWVLVPANEISVGTAVEKLAAQAREYLERVAKQHPGTPWAYLAQRELKEALGWKWTERHTGVNDPPRMAGGDGGGNPQDSLRKLEKPKPVRPNIRL